MMNCSSVVRLAVPAFVSLVAFLLLVSGCSTTGRSIKATDLGSANQIMVYQGGTPIIERSVAAGSDEDKTVASWLRSHEGGWHADFVSYAPARRVRGERFTLDFHKDRCILNYQTNDKGDWSQVSRPMAEDEPIPAVFTPAT